MPSLVRWKREGTVYIPGRERDKSINYVTRPPFSTLYVKSDQALLRSKKMKFEAKTTATTKPTTKLSKTKIFCMNIQNI